MAEAEKFLKFFEKSKKLKRSENIHFLVNIMEKILQKVDKCPKSFIFYLSFGLLFNKELFSGG